MSEKFRMAAINLIEDLNKLSYIGGKARWMLSPDEVLEPTKHYSNHFPINLASCSSTALKLHDTDYSSTSTVQNFIERAWVGVNFIQVRVAPWQWGVPRPRRAPHAAISRESNTTAYTSVSLRLAALLTIYERWPG